MHKQTTKRWNSAHNKLGYASATLELCLSPQWRLPDWTVSLRYEALASNHHKSIHSYLTFSRERALSTENFSPTCTPVCSLRALTLQVRMTHSIWAKLNLKIQLRESFDIKVVRSWYEPLHCQCHATKKHHWTCVPCIASSLPSQFSHSMQTYLSCETRFHTAIKHIPSSMWDPSQSPK